MTDFERERNERFSDQAAKERRQAQAVRDNAREEAISNGVTEFDFMSDGVKKEFYFRAEMRAIWTSPPDR